MTSKERVHAALNRKPVDRIPISMWFHPQTTLHLSRLLEIPPAFVGEAMGNDIVQAWVNNNYAMEGIVHAQEGEGHIDFWNIEWKKIGEFNQIVHYPLEQASPEEVVAYRFPKTHMEELLLQMNPLLLQSADKFLGCDVSPCVFEMYCRLRGMGQALLDLVDHEKEAFSLLSRCADFSVTLAQEACSRFSLDWLWTGDDVAAQDNLMMSPQTWRSMIRPPLQKVIDVGKNAGIWNAYHCCGALRPIIPDLIEMGIDVLNPIQTNCPGMDPLDLKREYGIDLAFMGGVDTIDILPNGSVSQVRSATRRLIDGMTADGGGYILAASHTIPPETPHENIFAMYEEAGLNREEIFDRAANIRNLTADDTD
jgi:uroporphyrinogen decarboxylase